MAGEWIISASGGGSSIAEDDTFLSLRFISGSGLPVKPVEEGSFFTANKWDTPYQAVVTLAKYGNPGDLNSFMKALDKYKRSTDLVDIVTPYYVFVKGNIQAIEYQFDMDETGQGMVVPNITIQEIRLIKTSTTSSDIGSAGAKNPGSVSSKDVGQVSANQVGTDRSFIKEWGG